jgi:hypothetical protein
MYFLSIPGSQGTSCQPIDGHDGFRVPIDRNIDYDFHEAQRHNPHDIDNFACFSSTRADSWSSGWSVRSL